eukprot:gnl/MRDRNA2_/MRDRNA2_55924_c0_seq1.p1 gnl/MRDRNA2_/MRDRNA2_55924_c0~~gnl/MRDRNA2_/MRDRNA2_55924_c0_seq1.p1  ORF type:complete len:417 (-),score=63.05 gnl/MRDRNA2_/MRDRNA2_55924_c0_seq1:46-1296(-)
MDKFFWLSLAMRHQLASAEREGVYLSIVNEVLSGNCKKFRAHSPYLQVPDGILQGDAKPMNRTAGLLMVQAPVWHAMAANAIVSIAEFSMAARVFCSMAGVRCPEILGQWGAAWCLFIRRLQVASKLIPTEEGYVISALDTSVKGILVNELPQALSGTLAGLANGTISVGDGLAQVENATVIFQHYLEYASLLGEEFIRHGRKRVAKARFHGEATSMGFSEGRMHRADVLLWALGTVSGDKLISEGFNNATASRARSPYVAELGVDRADVSERLLSMHPTLRWLGIDMYQEVEVTSESCTIWHHCHTGSEVLLSARKRLLPWLSGNRAQLMIANSTQAAQFVSESKFDLVFVDADHSERGAAADLAAWARHVRPGGVLAGHDYCPRFAGVVEAAHAALPRGATLHLGPDMVYWWHL